MNIEKYTDRARGFVQSAQSLALRDGHQQFGPEHLLKVLLDDPEGLAAGLIDRSGGNSRAALAAPPASSIWSRHWRGYSRPPKRPPKRPAIPSSRWSGCCWRWRSKRTT